MIDYWQFCRTDITSRKYKKSFSLRKYRNIFNIRTRKFHFRKYKGFFSGYNFFIWGRGLGWEVRYVAAFYLTNYYGIVSDPFFNIRMLFAKTVRNYFSCVSSWFLRGTFSILIKPHQWFSHSVTPKRKCTLFFIRCNKAWQKIIPSQSM